MREDVDEKKAKERERNKGVKTEGSSRREKGEKEKGR